jgi:DNA-binding LacI/PurR family transcriptional regulator
MTLYTAKKSCSLEHAHRINPSAQNGTETALGGVELPIKMKDSYIADFIPSLQYLLQRKGVSAIVALSDDGARHYSVWCAASGIHIPRDFTLVSFDNSRYAEALHFTSIDFRLDFAGHKAADLFVNPGRALTRSMKTIASQPLLVVRESGAYVEGMV